MGAGYNTVHGLLSAFPRSIYSKNLRYRGIVLLYCARALSNNIGLYRYTCQDMADYNPRLIHKKFTKKGEAL